MKSMGFSVKIAAFLLSLCLFALAFTACADGQREKGKNSDGSSPLTGSDMREGSEDADAFEKNEEASDDAEQKDSEDDMKPSDKPTETPRVLLTAGEFSASVELADTAAAGELLQMLPMTMEMSELNGNEKYFYMSESLPTAAKKPDGIRAGDLMLYGDSCIVLFYESFNTSYSYTPLGRLTNTNGLAKALGKGNVTVTIATQE